MTVKLIGKTNTANQARLQLTGESVLDFKDFKAAALLFSFKINQAITPGGASQETFGALATVQGNGIQNRGSWIDFYERPAATNIQAAMRTKDGAGVKTNNLSDFLAISSADTTVNLWVVGDFYANTIKFYANGSQLGSTVTPPGSGVGFDDDWSEIDFIMRGRVLDGLDYELNQFAVWAMPNSETTNANINNFIPTQAEILAHTYGGDVSALASVAPRILIKPTGTNNAQFTTFANAGSQGGNLTQTNGAAISPDWPHFINPVSTYPQVIVIKGDTNSGNKAELRIQGHTAMPSLPKGMCFHARFKLRGPMPASSENNAILGTSPNAQSQGGVVYLFSGTNTELSLNIRSEDDAGQIAAGTTQSTTLSITTQDQEFSVWAKVDYLSGQKTIKYWRDGARWGADKVLTGANPRLFGGAITPRIFARNSNDFELINYAIWFVPAAETNAANIPTFMPSDAQIAAYVSGAYAGMPSPAFNLGTISGKTNYTEATAITNIGTAGGAVNRIAGQSSGTFMPAFFPKIPLNVVDVSAITKTTASVNYLNDATGTLYLMTGLATKNATKPTAAQVIAGLNQDGSAGILNTVTLSAQGAQASAALTGLTYGSGYHTYGVIQNGTTKSDAFKWTFSTVDIVSRTSLKLIGQSLGFSALELQGHTAIAQGIKGISCLIRGRIKGALTGLTETSEVFSTSTTTGQGVTLSMTSNGTVTKMRMNMRALNSGGSISAATTQSNEITIPEADFDFIIWGVIDCLSASPTVKYFAKITSGQTAGLMGQLGSTITLTGTSILPDGGPFIPKFTGRKVASADIEFHELRIWTIPAAETNAANLNTHIPSDSFIGQYWAEKSLSTVPAHAVGFRPSGLTYDNNTLAASVTNFGAAGGNFVQVSGATTSPNWPHFTAYEELAITSVIPKAFEAAMNYFSQASGRMWLIVTDPLLNTSPPSRDQIKLKQNFDGSAVIVGLDFQLYETKAALNYLLSVLSPGEDFRIYAYIEKGYSNTNVITLDFTTKIPGLAFVNGTHNLKLPGGANYTNQTGMTVKLGNMIVTESATTDSQGVLSEIDLTPMDYPGVEIGEVKRFDISKGFYSAVVPMTITDIT